MVVLVKPRDLPVPRPAERTTEELLLDMRIGNKYDIREKIGEGSFGSVFRAVNYRTGSLAAIKFERRDCPQPQLFHEVGVYRHLLSANEHHANRMKAQADPDLEADFGPDFEADSGPAIGIPKIHCYGEISCGTGYRYFVSSLLGDDLETLFERHGRQFSLKTILMLGEEMINRVEFMHKKSYLHCDLKPENLMFGRVGNRTSIL